MSTLLLEDDDDLDTGEERPINAPQLIIETSECPESNLGAPGELLKSDRHNALGLSTCSESWSPPITVPTISFAGEAEMYTTLSPLQFS